MASSTKKAAAAEKPEKQEQAFVTKVEFEKLVDVLGGIMDKLDRIETKASTPAPGSPEEKEAKEVSKAKPDMGPINPAWEEKAQEILGEALDHCEVFYPKAGGQIFTVVIKNDHSNAGAEYLERTKVDRRSREIGSEGLAGVELWCKLVRQNLQRGKNKIN